jgi:thiol-disulfide isomerase/thioredoxin
MFTGKVVSIITITLLIVLFGIWKLFFQGIKPTVLEDIKQGNKVVLLFSAEWCSTCKEIKPSYEEVKKEFPDIHFYEVTSDVNRVQQKLMFKRYDIHGIPTFIIFNNAKEVDRFNGLQTKEELREYFKILK